MDDMTTEEMVAESNRLLACATCIDGVGPPARCPFGWSCTYQDRRRVDLGHSPERRTARLQPA